MIKLLLKGIYNHGEVIWLDTKWSIMRLFRHFIYTFTHEKIFAWAAFDGWVEIMPSSRMIRYCSYRGSVTYCYAVIEQGTFEGQPLIVRMKGWKCDADAIQGTTNEAIRQAIKEYNDLLFYKAFEKSLR